MTGPGERAPRALLVCDHFIRYETGLAQGLRANGWEPILLGRDHDLAFDGEHGAMRRYVSERLGPELRFLEVQGRVRDPNGLRSVARASRQRRVLAPDVTHVQTCLTSDPRLAFAAGLRPHRYAITVHDVGVHFGDPAPPRVKRATWRALVRHAGLVFVHAEPLRESLLARGITQAPVVVVPHGVEDAERRPLPSQPGLLFFGRIREYKGLSVLLDALERLWRRRPHVILTVAGEGQLPDHPALEDRRVRLLHRHILESEVADLYGDASIVVLPYLEASQSGVGSLAKGHGRPLVASAVGGLIELLSDGSGELVAPEDADALAATLDELLGDRIRLERMGRAGLRTLRETAGWPVVAARTVAAYERYLGVGEIRGHDAT